MWYGYAKGVKDLSPQLTSLVINCVVNYIINVFVLFNIKFLHCVSQFNLLIDAKYLFDRKVMMSKEN